VEIPGGPPKSEQPSVQRLAHLEGLRGVASLQVVALHYFSALLPGVVFIGSGAALTGWGAALTYPPLSFLFDGSGAVCLFFLLSGAVLSLSFDRQPHAMVGNAVRRVIRLGVPATAALIFSFVALAAIPQAHRRAARLTGSAAFLGANMDSPLTARFLAQEIALDSMVAGYSDLTPFRVLWRWPRPVQRSLDPPVWTLHLELYGSLLVLFLVWTRSVSPVANAAMSLGALWLLISNPLVLFVVGHLAAPLLRSSRWRAISGTPAAGVGGILLVATGIALSVAAPLHALAPVQGFVSREATFRRFNAYGYTLQHMAGETLIFAGVLASAALQRALGGRLLRRLGRLSFSIYLLHFPILFTVVSTAIIQLPSAMNALPRFALAAVVGLVLTALLSILFERWVDRPATALSRRVGGKVAAMGGAPAWVRWRWMSRAGAAQRTDVH
jgi:peptidoglycan/LPS O-acetylase OafA/YrhL